MLKNKLVVVSLIAAGFIAAVLLLNLFPSVETFAQRVIKSVTQFENNWQYCAITRINAVSPPPDRLDEFVGNVEVTYFVYTYDRVILKESYLKTDTITHKLNYAEFLQEKGLRSSPQAQVLANQRAADLALAKAMTQLGKDGWEMIGRSFANFNFETSEATSEYKNSLYFRRHISQRQMTAPQQ